MSSVMTVAALKDSGFYYAKENVSNADELIDILHYIDFLAQNNAVDAGSLELPIDDGAFKLTKSEVTKLFFGHIEKRAIESTALPIPIPQADAERMLDFVTAAKARNRTSMLALVTQWRREAGVLWEQAETKLSQAVARQREIDAIMDKDPKLVLQELVEKLPTTNWDFLEFTGYQNRLKFVSRSDIILVHKQPASGLSYELNCGRFRVEIRLDNMQIKVYGHDRHVEETDGNFIHPHVSMEDSVCWGSAKVTAEDSRMTGDVLKLLQILDALLPNYGDNPYITINDFKASIERRDERLRRKREQKEKAPEIAEGEYGEQDFLEPDDIDDLQFFDEEPIAGGPNE